MIGMLSYPAVEGFAVSNRRILGLQLRDPYRCRFQDAVIDCLAIAAHSCLPVELKCRSAIRSWNRSHHLRVERAVLPDVRSENNLGAHFPAFEKRADDVFFHHVPGDAKLAGDRAVAQSV